MRLSARPHREEVDAEAEAEARQQRKPDHGAVWIPGHRPNLAPGNFRLQGRGGECGPADISGRRIYAKGYFAGDTRGVRQVLLGTAFAALAVLAWSALDRAAGSSSHPEGANGYLGALYEVPPGDQHDHQPALRLQLRRLHGAGAP